MSDRCQHEWTYCADATSISGGHTECWYCVRCEAQIILWHDV